VFAQSSRDSRKELGNGGAALGDVANIVKQSASQFMDGVDHLFLFD
jgi:hypothetical protein